MITRPLSLLSTLAILTALLALPVQAQTTPAPAAPAMVAPMPEMPDEQAAATQSVEDPFGAIMMNMHDGMSEPSGDIDADFVRSMIPHHQAAVDMAKVELQRGHDQFTRKLATDILKSQQKEIDAMKQWLAAHEDAD